MAKIRLVKKKTNEMSGTGGSASATPGTGAQYAAPKAFPKVAKDYNKTFGTHFAPSIPNRPSKAITYKEIWESGTDEVVVTLKNSQLDPDVKKLLFKGYTNGDISADTVLKIVSSLINEETSDDADFDSATTGADGLQTTNPLPPSINEGRYSEFKKTTQVRTPSEQMHRAVREIRRKIDEINKLVDYTEKMKSEMKSDVNEVRYLNRTKEALAKISAKIQETNNKIKRLVQ
jgi:hypothetical protein